MANRMSSLGVIGIALGIIIVGAIFVAMYVRATYNDLVGMQEQAKTAWAQVENQLQRRNDLIPNYVETVKGYAKQETTIFTAIADARARMAGARNPAETIAANNQLESALARLLVVVENYPVLKSSENFMRLQDELAGTENRIATERMRYNEVVRDYNVRIRRFPANLVAGAFNFAAMPLFEAPEAAKAVPQVKF
ncbi:MAG TPA: LemA family protein [Candidatus Omnitrophota bacterium]|jgi:LemA protein|nr:LemA family protein [Candidatus Omnitrophota bacterium]